MPKGRNALILNGCESIKDHFGDLNKMEPHTTFDYAQLDRPEDELAELLRLTPEQAQRVLNWHAEQSKREISQSTSKQLYDIIQLFTERGANSRLTAVALAYAGGLERTIGLGSLRDAAASVGYTVAQLSKLILKIQRQLKLESTIFNKAPETRETYRQTQLADHFRRRKFKLR